MSLRGSMQKHYYGLPMIVRSILSTIASRGSRLRTPLVGTITCAALTCSKPMQNGGTMLQGVIRTFKSCISLRGSLVTTDLHSLLTTMRKHFRGLLNTLTYVFLREVLKQSVTMQMRTTVDIMRIGLSQKHTSQSLKSGTLYV